MTNANEGWIRRDHAMAVYGVILTDDGLVDEAATDTLRRSLREASGAQVPIEVPPGS